MLSDTQLALASLEISLLKLAKRGRKNIYKKEDTILCLSRKMLVGDMEERFSYLNFYIIFIYSRGRITIMRSKMRNG